MRPRNRRQNRSLGQLMITVFLFLGAGVVLMLHVWLPVQAQRKLTELRVWEKQLSQEKNSLRLLSIKYMQMTSLPVLDKWAKSQGSWRSPRGTDVVMIHD